MNDEVASLMNELLDHEIYEQINSIGELQCFMQTHVFAVWDFMSLVKRLQTEMTTVSLPWLPPADKSAARLINEIVLCEESDVDIEGKASSHLEMYLDAMDEVGADARQFKRFIDCIAMGESLDDALDDSEAPKHVRKFVRENIQLAANGRVEEVASNFLYAREHSIPYMFTKLMQRWDIQKSDAPRMFYYLKRHIEVDGDKHGPAARNILERLVGEDEPAKLRAIEAAKRAIKARISLWDALNREIIQQRASQGLVT